MKILYLTQLLYKNIEKQIKNLVLQNINNFKFLNTYCVKILKHSLLILYMYKYISYNFLYILNRIFKNCA